VCNRCNSVIIIVVNISVDYVTGPAEEMLVCRIQQKAVLVQTLLVG